jgi:uncharacterized protein YlxW (UPF0749 family)
MTEAAGVIIALAAFVATLLGALIVTVWRASAIATEQRAETMALRKDVEREREERRRLASLFPPVITRVAVLEQRATSTDKFRAVSQSRHDWNEEK